MTSHIFICIKVFYNFDRHYTDSRNSLIKINNAKFFKQKQNIIFLLWFEMGLATKPKLASDAQIFLLCLQVRR